MPNGVDPWVSLRSLKKGGLIPNVKGKEAHGYVQTILWGSQFTEMDGSWFATYSMMFHGKEPSSKCGCFPLSETLGPYQTIACATIDVPRDENPVRWFSIRKSLMKSIHLSRIFHYGHPTIFWEKKHIHCRAIFLAQNIKKLIRHSSS